jgi:hypothetical protein
MFADTQIEDEDLYRFLYESADNVGGELITIEDGRDVWTVFFDNRYLGNSRIDPCSRILKRDLLRAYIEEHYPPETSVIHLGIDWTEEDRYQRAKPRWKPYTVVAPLTHRPYLSKETMLELLENEGIDPPRLYEYGFPHNNCGGFCVKAGQAQFKLLYKTFPERFMYHAHKEQEIREFLDKDVSILRKMENGVRRNLPLLELKEMVDKDEGIDELDWGGCGCAID